jgi:hypothetical protein
MTNIQSQISFVPKETGILTIMIGKTKMRQIIIKHLGFKRYKAARVSTFSFAVEQGQDSDAVPSICELYQQ